MYDKLGCGYEISDTAMGVQPRDNALSTRCVVVDSGGGGLPGWHIGRVSLLSSGVVDGGGGSSMSHGQRTVRTVKKREAFLAALRSHGVIGSACQASGISRTAAYEWRADDADFAAAWDAAVQDATDTLEHEAIRRATDGSDTLLIFLLKANRPEKYRETNNLQVNAKHEHSGPNGQPIGIAFFDANAALTALTGGPDADR